MGLLHGIHRMEQCTCSGALRFPVLCLELITKRELNISEKISPSFGCDCQFCGGAGLLRPLEMSFCTKQTMATCEMGGESSYWLDFSGRTKALWFAEGEELQPGHNLAGQGAEATPQL
ncbi:hypothetical protein KIL84_010162 [Mauremys mutica]|uniref:Uncharacterized protein n=1 Tax=Mauremys mutica TaxID=74926 RepID=A0A9D3XNB5_9SAUR|nr:hypothetical protein KIL84_010162 [Mauremys mutica]